MTENDDDDYDYGWKIEFTNLIKNVPNLDKVVDINEAFKYRMNNTSIDMIIIYLNLKYYLYSGNEDPFNFILNTIKFPKRIVNINQCILRRILCS